MKKRVFVTFVISVILTAFCLYGQEKDDLSLFEIDRLIRKTEYDEALNQLNTYIKNKPENFDNAQIRIKRIMNAKKQYSILAEKLIDLIQTDPGNNKEIYEITAQLEKFERHPSDQNLQFIADLKKSAEFNYFRSLFLEIQNESAKNTQEGKYIAAIEKTKEGFWLYKDNFDEKWEDSPEITQPVAAILLNLDSQITAYEEKNFISRINDVINDFIKAVNQEHYDLALERYKNVQNSMQQYNKIRQAIVNDAVAMQNKFAEIQEIDEDSTDASFLPFMFRFVYGVESVPDSGILGAIDAQWNEMTGRMNTAVYTVLRKHYEKYAVSLDDNYVNEITRYVALQQKVLDLYQIPNGSVLSKSELNTASIHPITNPYEDFYSRTDYVRNLAEQSVRISKVWNKVLQTSDSQEKMLLQIKNEQNIEPKTGYVKNLFEMNAELGALIGLRQPQELESYEWARTYNQLELDEWSGLSENYTVTLDNIFAKSNAMFTNAWTEITSYYRESADLYYTNGFAYNNSADKYTTGFFTKIPQNILTEINRNISLSRNYEDTFNADPELDFGINYAYPDLAIKILNFNQQEIDKAIENISAYQNQILSSYDSNDLWRTDENIETLVYEAISYMDTQKEKLAELRTVSASKVALAQSKIVASQLAKNEADIRFREAENALRAENFETARKKLQDALSKYDEALNNQNDEQLRAECDTKLQELGERIAKSENEIVVREVRDLKTLAKDAYFNGRFDDAEKYLNQARNRWAVTNVTPDEEITNLLNFVNTAISMKDGREILPSMPQYPEMSQLLNVSYQYFDEGSRKIGEGDKTGGYVDLDLALENIQKLQYVYPLNQEASLLTLRISRLKDPKKFREEFSQKIEAAKVMCKNPETRQQGYANLLDYYQLDPDYKGLKDLIYQTEIDIGIRQKPVDNSGANKAKRLITEAQNIYKAAGNDEKKLEAALAKIDQALALVSDNRTAIALKDEITTKIGGNTATVLSTEDERLYQLAIQRLQNNNVVGANAIVEKLLKKKSNGNSQKIKDLKVKIDARS